MVVTPEDDEYGYYLMLLLDLISQQPVLLPIIDAFPKALTYAITYNRSNLQLSSTPIRNRSLSH